jgi:L-2-hydroxyglutarate oxidase LhgO
LQSLAEKAKVMREKGIGDVPLRWLSGGEVQELEPDVVDTVHGALLSSETGIVGSHELMESLEKGRCASRCRVPPADKLHADQRVH